MADGWGCLGGLHRAREGGPGVGHGGAEGDALHGGAILHILAALPHQQAQRQRHYRPGRQRREGRHAQPPAIQPLNHAVSVKLEYCNWLRQASKRRQRPPLTAAGYGRQLTGRVSCNAPWGWKGCCPACGYEAMHDLLGKTRKNSQARVGPYTRRMPSHTSAPADVSTLPNGCTAMHSGQL